MSKIFDDKFNKLTVKQQYFILKYAMKDEDKAGEILASDDFHTWITDNRETVAHMAPEWNVQYNKVFKP